MNGMWAFLVVVALCVATFFLGRSLFAHLRKVPASFDPPVGELGGERGERPRSG